MWDLGGRIGRLMPWRGPLIAGLRRVGAVAD